MFKKRYADWFWVMFFLSVSLRFIASYIEYLTEISTGKWINVLIIVFMLGVVPIVRSKKYEGYSIFRVRFAHVLWWIHIDLWYIAILVADVRYEPVTEILIKLMNYVDPINLYIFVLTIGLLATSSVVLILEYLAEEAHRY